MTCCFDGLYVVNACHLGVFANPFVGPGCHFFSMIFLKLKFPFPKRPFIKLAFDFVQRILIVKSVNSNRIGDNNH